MGMARSKKTRGVPRRVLAHVLLVGVLCAARPALGISAGQQEHAVQIVAAAFSSPTVLVNRTNQKVDHAKQRTGVDSAVLLVLLRQGAQRSGYAGTEVLSSEPIPSHVFIQSGRSPPVAIS